MPGKGKVKRSTERNEKRWWCHGVQRREIQYCIHKCSTYFGECLWRIMYYALAFNKKFWDLACPLSWCIFEDTIYLIILRTQRWIKTATKYHDHLTFEITIRILIWASLKRMKSRNFITKGLVVMVIWMTLENYAAIEHAKKMYERFDLMKFLSLQQNIGVPWSKVNRGDCKCKSCY